MMIIGQKLFVRLSVCLTVNHGGANHSHCA